MTLPVTDELDFGDSLTQSMVADLMRQLGIADKRPDSKPFVRWARERLWIRPKTGGQIPFDLTPLQKKYRAMKRLAIAQGKPPRFLTLKYRRGGITTLEQAESYRLTQDNADISAVTLAHTTEDTAKIFRIARLFHDRDVDALPLKGVGNTKRLEYPTTGSIFETITAGSAGPGRGSTLQRAHWSEVSKSCLGPRQIEKQEDILAGLTEATSHGEIVLETTANGVEHFCNLYREAKAGQNDWTPIFLRWFDDRTNVETVTSEEAIDIVQNLSDREKELVVRFGLSPEQIKWRRTTARRLKRLFLQEYPENDETCFLTSGVRFFDSECVVELLETLPEYDTGHIPGGYYVEWKKPNLKLDYVLGADTSEGVEGGDPCGYGILETKTGEQVAALHGLFRPKQLGKLIEAAYHRWHRPLLGVERENHGHAVIQYLEGDDCTIDPEDIYRFKPDSAGWSTNAKTRPLMLDDLAEAVHDGLMEVHDRHFVSELSTFGLRGNRWDHDPGQHDDSLIKWAIAWQMLNFASQREPGEVYCR